MKPFILFCSDPSHSRRVDLAYDAERLAVEAVGGAWSVFSFEALVEGRDEEETLRRFQAQGPLALYRGWMLTPERYGRLAGWLEARGVRLINTVEQYRHCHHLPESYPLIESMTPRSVWLAPGEQDPAQVSAALARFGDGPVLVKDYVKSRKHEWAEACFIPRASDTAAAWKVVSRFLELQGEDLAGGLVFREFVRFAPLAVHSRSGMPLTREYRLFFLDAECLALAPYWEEGEYTEAPPPLEPFAACAQAIRSRFFTMDVAQLEDGRWLVVELGDAQVAGLPERLPAQDFHAALARRWAGLRGASNGG